MRTLPAAGTLLREQLGDAYVTIATMTGQGTFRGWKLDRTTGTFDRLVKAFPPIPQGSYPWYFRHRNTTAMLIPLRGIVPSWLSGPAGYHWGAVDGSSIYETMSLPAYFDAVVYFDQTRPFTELE